MANLTVPRLTLRLEKGQSLTAAEHDNNLKTLRDFCNSLSALFGVSLNTDGSLKPGTVEAEDLKDRSVTRPKLALDALPYFEDTGTANQLIIAPTPAATALADGSIFFIKVKTANTGVTTLKVSALVAKPVKKLGGQSLVSGDLAAGSVIAVAWDAATQEFRLIAGSSAATSAGGESSASNFTGLSKYTGDEKALAAAPYTWLHGLDDRPATVEVWLRCVVADAGYAAGDIVPATSVSADTGYSDGNKFNVRFDASEIEVSENGTDYYVGTTALDPGSWNIFVTASKIYNEAAFYFPAQEFGVAGNVVGCWSYKTNLFFVKEGASGTPTYLTKVPLGGGSAGLVPWSAGSPKKLNPGLFRRENGLNVVVACSDAGTYVIDCNDPASGVRWDVASGSDADRFKPVHIVESGGNITEIYACGSFVGLDPDIYVSRIPCRKLVVGGYSNHGTPLNLTDTRIKYWNGSAWAADGDNPFLDWTHTSKYPLLFQFNPVKRRMYIVSTESGLLHIFHLSGSDDFATWFAKADADRYPALYYVKALPIAGCMMTNSVDDNSKMFVEFDLDTGAEAAVVLRKYGVNHRQGTVVRARWREIVETVDEQIAAL